jgi:AcrR family transcriptional regulator
MWKGGEMNVQRWFEPKQQRARPTVEALINATIDELREHGPSGLRQDRVLAASGIAQGSLYHHFGSRDGLIDAAYATVFTRATERVVERVRSALEQSSNIDDLTARLIEIVEYLIGEDHDEARRDAVSVLAAATTRPSLAALVDAEQRRITGDVADIIAELQRFGIVSAQLDPSSVATFIQAFSLGQIVITIDNASPEFATWRATVFAALSGFAVPTDQRDLSNG